MQTEEYSSRRRRRGSRPPFNRRRNRHPGLAEREDTPRVPPTPKGDIPESFSGNAFGTLNPLLQHAIAEEGYLEPTPIQAQSIPILLEGRDLLGCAQTGTGKTAAFLLPILHRLALQEEKAEPMHPRALVLAPTRELAAQIATCAASYGKYMRSTFAVVFGGVSQVPQVKALKTGAELVIATPGRLFDLMDQGYVSLDAIQEFVLDEADRMLDMGFLPDIEQIIAKLPEVRHSQFFSATLSKEVLKLAHTMVRDPAEITISPDQPTVDRINQMLMFVDKPDKCALLTNLLEEHPEYEKVLVFSRTRHGADKIVRALEDADISAEAIHSDKTQRMRTNTLAAFKRGRVRVLVATDIASRGIDVDNITHVINFDLPEETESYIHRIGRTARAGASGAAISFVSSDERGLLRAIERMIKKEIDICRDQPFHSERAERAAGKARDENGAPVPPWRKKRERPERRSSHAPSHIGGRQSDFHAVSEASEIAPPDDDGSPRPPKKFRDRKPPRREGRPDRDERGPRFGDRERGRDRDREYGRDRDRDFDRDRPRFRRDRDDRDERPRRRFDDDRRESRNWRDGDGERPRRRRDEGDGFRRRDEGDGFRRRAWDDKPRFGRRNDRDDRPPRGRRGDDERPSRDKRKDEAPAETHWYDQPFQKNRKRRSEQDELLGELDSKMRKYARESGDSDFDERPPRPPKPSFPKKGFGGGKRSSGGGSRDFGGSRRPGKKPMRSGSFDRFKKKRGPRF